MCLERITNWQTADEGVGYKVYSEDKEGILRSMVTEDIVIENEWLRAEEKNCSALDQSPFYSKGFHIFKFSRIPFARWDFISSDPGRKIRMRKVKYRKVICSGTQQERISVIVAEEIMVIDKRKLPKPEVVEEVLINK